MMMILIICDGQIFLPKISITTYLINDMENIINFDKNRGAVKRLDKNSASPTACNQSYISFIRYMRFVPIHI